MFRFYKPSAFPRSYNHMWWRSHFASIKLTLAYNLWHSFKRVNKTKPHQLKHCTISGTTTVKKISTYLGNEHTPDGVRHWQVRFFDDKLDIFVSQFQDFNSRLIGIRHLDSAKTILLLQHRYLDVLISRY